ncbi:hypothetical protein ANANG_G00173400 [Anguilla anguilla]|uniref:Uncharacterized protein n=1 Tax=Anguilla anguilla TaxID=7936 RepID=A0A9D3RU96_ANGAN|nr:hypothetical protein ANANG_G00173400 [Anguilla anguilla]
MAADSNVKGWLIFPSFPSAQHEVREGEDFAHCQGVSASKSTKTAPCVEEEYGKRSTSLKARSDLHPAALLLTT